MSILTKAIIENSLVVSAVESKDIVNEAIKVQGLSPLSANALGRTLTMVALMGKELKDEDDYLTVTIDGGGPLGKITACADAKGHVKGNVANPGVENIYKADGSLDLGSAVGRNGNLTVIKDIGLKQPYVGVSPIVSGEIAVDFAKYFADSEQQPCGITLGCSFDSENALCKSAGGVFVQVMPNCPDDLLERVETIMYAMNEMSYQFEDSTAKQVISRFFGEFNLVFTEEVEVVYKCDCSKQKIDRVIKSLGKDEAKDIIAEQGKIEVCCQFCGKKYCYNEADVEKLFNN